LRYVHDALDVEHPLASEQFKTNGVDLFVERLGKIINASREGQLGMKAVLVGSLARVEYDERGRAVRLFPLLRRADGPRNIVIDPRRAFGRPSSSERRCRWSTSGLGLMRATPSRNWRATSTWRPS
jgi:hypothetical protein